MVRWSFSIPFVDCSEGTHLYPPFDKNMKTIICDIDGTITDMWPIEKSVLLCMLGRSSGENIERLKLSGVSGTYQIYRLVSTTSINKDDYTRKYNRVFDALLKKDALPTPKRYPLVRWIIANKTKYRFVYATGGQKSETLYVLENLGLIRFFDLNASVDKSNCRYSKKTGIPFKKIKAKYSDCLLITDSRDDCAGANRVQIPSVLVNYWA